MEDDLRKDVQQLAKQADHLAQIVSDQAHFPGAETLQLLQGVTRVLAELAERCPRLQGQE